MTRHSIIAKTEAFQLNEWHFTFVGRNVDITTSDLHHLASTHGIGHQVNIIGTQYNKGLLSATLPRVGSQLEKRQLHIGHGNEDDGGG